MDVTSPDCVIFSDKSAKHTTNTGNSSLYEKHCVGVNIDGKIRKVLTTRNDGEIVISPYNCKYIIHLGEGTTSDELFKTGIKSYGH